MISHYQEPFEVCQAVLSTDATLQICFWSFHHNVTRDRVCSLMNTIWYWPEERTYLAYCLLPSPSLEERLSRSNCFLSSFLYLLTASYGRLGCCHHRSSAVKASCQGRRVWLWWGEGKWLDHSISQSSSCVHEACHTNASHATSAHGVFVRRLWARACLQKEECSATEREKNGCGYRWWKLKMCELQKKKLKKNILPVHGKQEDENGPWNTFWWPTNEKSPWESLWRKLQGRPKEK